MLGSRDWLSADVAQLAEHLICNQAVASSSLAVSSVSGSVGSENAESGGVPKRPTGADCKSAGSRLRRFESFPHHYEGSETIEVEPAITGETKRTAGVAQLVERKPSKLDVAGSSPVSRSGQLNRLA